MKNKANTLSPLVAAIVANESAQPAQVQPEAVKRNTASETLATLSRTARSAKPKEAKRVKTPAVDVAKLWLINATTADGNPVRNQFAATLDAIRSGLGLAKTEPVPTAVFEELKTHSRMEASKSAASWHNFHTVSRLSQKERGALLKTGGFAADRSTSTRHVDLPIEEQKRVGLLALAHLKASLAKREEAFLDADTITRKEEIAESAQAQVSKSIKMSEELRKIGQPATSAAMPESIELWIAAREKSRKASEEALAARRSAPRIGKRKTVDPVAPPIK